MTFCQIYRRPWECITSTPNYILYLLWNLILCITPIWKASLQIQIHINTTLQQVTDLSNIFLRKRTQINVFFLNFHLPAKVLMSRQHPPSWIVKSSPSYRLVCSNHCVYLHKDCQWLETGQWFSLVYTNNKTDCHDITEILVWNCC
jgi:hypothetical protein